MTDKKKVTATFLDLRDLPLKEDGTPDREALQARMVEIVRAMRKDGALPPGPAAEEAEDED